MRQPQSGTRNSVKYDLRPRPRSGSSSSAEANLSGVRTERNGSGSINGAVDVSGETQVMVPFLRSEMNELKDELTDLAMELLELETKCSGTLTLGADTDKECVASAFLAESRAPWRPALESSSPNSLRVATECSGLYSPLNLGLDIDFLVDPSPLPNLVESEVEKTLQHVSHDINQALANVDPSLEALDAFLSSLSELHGLEPQQSVVLPVSYNSAPSAVIDENAHTSFLTTKEFAQLETVAPDKLLIEPSIPGRTSNECASLRFSLAAQPCDPGSVNVIPAYASSVSEATLFGTSNVDQAMHAAQTSQALNQMQVAYYSITHPVVAPYCSASNAGQAQQMLLPQVQQALILPQMASTDNCAMTWPASAIQQIPVAVPVQVPAMNTSLLSGSSHQAANKTSSRCAGDSVRVSQTKPTASVVASLSSLENCPRRCSFSRRNLNDSSVVTIAAPQAKKLVGSVDLTSDDSKKCPSASKVSRSKTSVTVGNSSLGKVNAQRMLKVAKSSPATAVFDGEVIGEEVRNSAGKSAVDNCGSKLCPASVMIKLPKLASCHDKSVEQQIAIRKRRRRRRQRIEEMSSRLAFRLARYSEDRITDGSTDEESQVAAICMSRRISNPAAYTEADE
ncbi:hypothetical protein [Saltwater crocodilepox virus]|nr:hypothetical protein [Saltwater crocodilepox virus]QGT49433.1 ORF209 [Saltwater crocodilepox virus]